MAVGRRREGIGNGADLMTKKILLQQGRDDGTRRQSSIYTVEAARPQCSKEQLKTLEVLRTGAEDSKGEGL